ncbi:MAG TPA: glycosyltransferase family 4 protein [Gaiellaceae bacterium]
MTFALSAYPISGRFREQLGVDEVVVLPELRRLPPTQLAAWLRRLRGTCLIALEDPASETLLPILEVVASLTAARSIEIAHGDGRRESTTRRRGALHGLQLATTSVAAQAELRRAQRETAALLAVEPRRADSSLERVLYLNANLWFGVTAGGSVAHVAGVVNGLAHRADAVELATAPAPVGIDERVAVRRLRPPKRYALPVEANLYRFGRGVPAQLRDIVQPTLVYQRHSVGSYAGAVLARRHDVALVLEYNGSEVWVARNWGRPLRYEQLALAAEEASLRHAHLVVTVSRALADELVARGVDESRVVWHPNGVDADAFDPRRFTDAQRAALRDRYGIADDATVVTFVGTFGQWHGVDVFARAIRDGAAWARRENVRYLLVGDGLTMPTVRSELEGLGDITTIAGLVPQSEAPLHLAASDILVSPHVPNVDGSPFFGSPTKLFEYMAAAKPIVASDLDQIGDVLRDDLAVLVRSGDPGDLLRGLKALVADPGRRARLAERSRQRVLERYTWTHHVDAILERL